MDHHGRTSYPAGDPTGGEPARAPSETPALRQGDIGYVSFWVPDVERAATFFSSVLGWTYSQASGPQGRQVEGLALHHGIWGGQERSTLFCCFAVDDLEAAIARVRSSGGTAEEPEVAPYGTISGCVDDQGVRFALFVPPDGPSRLTDPQADQRTHPQTDLPMGLWLTSRWRCRTQRRRVPSTDRFSDGASLRDVSTTDGRSRTYLRWSASREVTKSRPRSRCTGSATSEAAAALVRGAGGTASAPEAQPYGITSTCTDDQGTRFYLGQL